MLLFLFISRLQLLLPDHTVHKKGIVAHSYITVRWACSEAPPPLPHLTARLRFYIEDAEISCLYTMALCFRFVEHPSQTPTPKFLEPPSLVPGHLVPRLLSPLPFPLPFDAFSWFKRSTVW